MRYTFQNAGGHNVSIRLPHVCTPEQLPDVLRPFVSGATNTVTLPARSYNRVSTALHALGWRHA